MKLTHKNLELIEKWLDTNNVQPSLDHNFVVKVYEEVLLPLYDVRNRESVKKRDRAFTLQFDFVRRDLLKILYKRNDKSAIGIKAGYVYAIGNPAWKDWIKIGSAIDVNDRLNSYQTSSPLRDYYLIDYYFVEDRLLEESSLHSKYERNSEWCKVSQEDIKSLFKQKKSEHNIRVPETLLYAVKNEIEYQKRQKIDILNEKRRLKKSRSYTYQAKNKGNGMRSRNKAVLTLT
jgi:predicted DNA binding CopG/RHH family protein